MGELIFRINGVTRRRSRRFRKVAHQSYPIAKIATWFISVGIGTYVVGLVLPYMAAIIVGSHMGSNSVAQGKIRKELGACQLTIPVGYLKTGI